MSAAAGVSDRRFSKRRRQDDSEARSPSAEDVESEREVRDVIAAEEDQDREEEEEDDGNEEEQEDGDDDDDDEEEDDDDDEDEDDEEHSDEQEEDDESPFKFLEGLDPKLLGSGFDVNWLRRRPPTSLPVPSPSRAPSDTRSPAAAADDAEFYGAMIQMLTHVLGSSDSVTWQNQHTPGSQIAPSPFGHAYSSPAQTPYNAGASLSASSRSAFTNGKSELSAIQPLIQALIARLGKDQQLPRRPVGEQDLTALLQTLMEQQQRQQQDQQGQKRAAPQSSAGGYQADNYAFSHTPMAHVNPHSNTMRASEPVGTNSLQKSHSTSSTNTAYQPLQFADLDFEDEDEDDPDFNPDLNPDLPLPSAWSLAVRDVVASEESRAAAAAAAATVAASHSDTPSRSQTPRDQPAVAPASAPPQPQQPEPTVPRKRGRKPVLEPGEAQRRRAQRNVEYQRMRRQAKKAEEEEQGETVLELKAEVKMLRAEMERLRDENAMLRAQRELERMQRTHR